jgi:hypothetical protein
MGYNEQGELGIPLFHYVSTPRQIASDVKALAAGDYYSLFIKNDGSLWGMGDNVFGQLGDNTFNATNLPVLIVPNNVMAIACGADHSIFIKTDGSLWAMGNNSEGQLGDGSTNLFVNQPEQIVASNVVAIAAGGNHSLFITTDGNLWGMGQNGYGELGDGFTDTICPVPEQIFPMPQPVMTSSVSSQNNLQIQANCQFAGTFYLWSGTNLAQPLNQWTRILTNTISSRGTTNYSVILANGSNVTQCYYILQSQ